jgi:hypothetical protein
MPDFSLTGPDGQSYNVTAESPDLAQKALDYEFANRAPAQAVAATSPQPEARSFGSMLSGLIPGMGPKGWGPQNWEPPGYNAADAAVHGATFGASDYLRGFARDLRDRISPPTDFGGGGDYPTQTEQGGGLDIKNERDRFAVEHPYANIGANLAGAVAAAPVLPVGRALGAAGRIADPLLRRAAQWGTNIGIGAGLGGTAAALDEAPEGFGPAAKAAGRGALIGGGVGAVAYPLGQAIGAGVRRIGDYIASAPARAELGVGQPAIGAVQRGLTSDQAFGGGQGAQNIARAGPYGMAADAGPTTTGMLDEAMSSGGPGALTARNAIMQRGVDANRTLTGALDTALGQPVGVTTATRDISAAGAPARAASYETAYASPLDYSTEGGRRIEGLLGRVPESVIEKANTMMRLDGHTSSQILADVADNGTVTFRTLPDVRQLDYIKQALQHLAVAGEDAGALGGRTPISSKLMRLAGFIRDEVRDQVPAYGEALRLAGDDIGQINAIKFGADLLSPSVARDEVRIAIADMSPHDVAAVRQGLRSKIDEQIANVKAVVSNPNYDARQAMAALKDLNSQAAREKLAMVVTDPVQLAQLQRELDMATAAAELVANTAQNSKTAGRLATREAIGQATAPGMVGQAAEGRPWETLRSLWTSFTGRTPAEKLRVSDEMRGQIADLLTRQRDPATGRSVVDAIEGILPGLARSGERSRALGAIPGIMLPPEVEAARQYLRQGPPVPPGVFPPKG